MLAHMSSLGEHISRPQLRYLDGTVVEGRAGGECGDVVQVVLDVDDDGRIRGAGGRVHGRHVVAGTLSWLLDGIEGLDLLDAARRGLAAPDRREQVARLDPGDRIRAMTAEDALHHAIGNAALARAAASPDPRTLDPVDDPAAPLLVAMSGGVDSAVALIDSAAGQDVVGATLRLWVDPEAPDPEQACCAPDSVRRARRTCHERDIPHLSLDMREAFAHHVVTPFVAAYVGGLTPNPCVGCNGSFRLDALVRVARSMGCAATVTGHYVRRSQRGGVELIQRGVDAGKDQSYMLATVPPAITAQLRFPLGGRSKQDVRAAASRAGLEQAGLRESQEVCFLGGGDYRRFLERRGGLGRPGRIVDEDGRELARHDGIARFTPGQRRGLGNLGGATTGPRYVRAIDGATGTVTVGPASSLDVGTVRVAAATWHADPPGSLLARFRYRSSPVPVEVHDLGDGRWDIVVPGGVRAPAAGQVACIEDAEGRIVGAGTIMPRGGTPGPGSPNRP